MRHQTDPSVQEGLMKMGLRPEQYRPSADNSLRGPCLSCGGTRRMVVFLNRDFPGWYVMCDLCGLAGWVPNVVAGIRWPDGALPERATPKSVDYSSALATLRGGRVDVRYHDTLDTNDDYRQVWRDLGIPDHEQDFWRLGYAVKQAFRSFSDDVQESVMVLDAMTIPKYGLGWELMNIDFRMLGAPPSEGKYRPFPGAPTFPFVARPDLPSLINEDGAAYIVEGSKKAMALSLFLDGAQVLGVPSTNSWAGAQELLQGAPLVYVILDPDGWGWARKLSQAIGPSARQVTLPGKIDDLLAEGLISRETFAPYLALSRRNPAPRPPRPQAAIPSSALADPTA